MLRLCVFQETQSSWWPSFLSQVSLLFFMRLFPSPHPKVSEVGGADTWQMPFGSHKHRRSCRATFTHTGCGVVSQTTKSGTNRFTGRLKVWGTRMHQSNFEIYPDASLKCCHLFYHYIYLKTKWADERKYNPVEMCNITSFWVKTEQVFMSPVTAKTKHDWTKEWYINIF